MLCSPSLAGIDDEKRLVLRIERNRVTPGYCLGKQIEIYKSIENVQYHGIEKATETKARSTHFDAGKRCYGHAFIYTYIHIYSCVVCLCDVWIFGLLHVECFSLSTSDYHDFIGNSTSSKSKIHTENCAHAHMFHLTTDRKRLYL